MKYIEIPFCLVDSGGIDSSLPPIYVASPGVPKPAAWLDRPFKARCGNGQE